MVENRIKNLIDDESTIFEKYPLEELYIQNEGVTSI